MIKRKLSLLAAAGALLLSCAEPVIATDYSSWMSGINDNTKISAISIPGTHDSGATYEPVSGTAKTQNLSITDQLNAGVRFLDIRCRNYEDAFVIHHGSVYQHLNFDDVLTACKDFLAAHPTETIIMSVKEEYDASGNTLSFEQVYLNYMYKYGNLFWTHSYIPALSEVRGQIVLLRRFGANTWPLGLAATGGYGWGDNTTSTISYSNMTAVIQDCYKVGNNNNKWNVINTMYTDAKNNDGNTLYLNFTSGYKSFLGVPNIPYVSNTINKKIASYFSSDPYGHYGVSIMDFATADLCKAIIETNF